MNRLLIVAVIWISLVSAARAEHFHVFILAGQSNMDGRGQALDLVGELEKYAKPQAGVRIAYSNSKLRGPYATEGFVALGPGYSVVPGTREKFGDKYKLPGKTFGPEVSFGAAVAEGRPDWKVVLIKFSEGGTTLHKDWSPGNADGLYPQFMDCVHRRLVDLSANGDSYTVEAIVWHQGESDASLATGEYQRLLAEFIQHVRKDLGAGEAAVLIGEVFDNGHRDRVRAGEVGITGVVANSYFATSAGLATSDAGTHFDARSQIAMGERLARCFLTKKNMLAKDVTPATAPASRP